MGVLDLLNRLFAGLGEESLKMELFGILQDLRFEDLNDPTVQETIKEICESIVTLVTKKGKPYDVDTCIKDVTEAIKEEKAKVIARLAFESLRKLRRKKKSAEETGILPT